MKPSVCRMVHYVSYGTPGGEYDSVCRAAVIAEVLPAAIPVIQPPRNTCSLVVFNPTGLFFNDCEQDEETHRGGTWHWPERES
jgi:hypothetical protein